MLRSIDPLKGRLQAVRGGRRLPAIAHDYDFGSPWAELCGQHINEQLNVLATIAVDPPRLYPVFISEGGQKKLFNQPDTRAIHVAIEYAAEKRKTLGHVVSFAEFTLQKLNCWDPTIPAGVNIESRWSEPALWSLFDRFYPCEGFVKKHTRKLLALNWRMLALRNYYDAALRLLENSDAIAEPAFACKEAA